MSRLEPSNEAVASELEVLESIYGDNAIQLWPADAAHVSDSPQYPTTTRYQVVLSLDPPHDNITLKILVSLPATYPATSPPQLQLLSRYVGPFAADSALFGTILRTFISVNGVEWIPDSVCVFDGLQSVLEICRNWYEEHLSCEKAGDLLREDEHEPRLNSPVRKVQEYVKEDPVLMPEGIEMVEAEAITDRKSAFIGMSTFAFILNIRAHVRKHLGRACRITHPSQVPLILSHLMSDRRTSRAAHPIINAWRCNVGSVLHQDNDDDGETAAGGRLAHLLQILDVNDVLVVVTRYFGGIHLGPDRFKHINQAARNALEMGGFLDVVTTRSNPGRGKKR